jgi:hypothetical protein
VSFSTARSPADVFSSIVVAMLPPSIRFTSVNSA